jgi:hypothetical protein
MITLYTIHPLAEEFIPYFLPLFLDHRIDEIAHRFYEGN